MKSFAPVAARAAFLAFAAVTSVALAENLVENPGFETALPGKSLPADSRVSDPAKVRLSEPAHAGKYAVELLAPADDPKQNSADVELSFTAPVLWQQA